MAETSIAAATQASDPFRSWVPVWLKAVVAYIILAPVILINGAYSGSNLDVSSSLGILSEDINMAYYAASVGMAIAYIVIPLVKPVATTKTIILIVLLFQIILSLVCAQTPYIEVIIICSFFIGYFKAFSMIEIINILMPILSKSGTRNEFYAKYYPFVLMIGQLSLALTSELADAYNWQYMYYFMIILLLLALLAVVICMRYARRLVRLPIGDIDWLALFNLSVCYMCVVYICTYGKTKDWFVSPYIMGAAILIPICGWLFVRRQFGKKALVDMNVLKNRSSVVVYLLSFVLMFFVSFNVPVSSYMRSVLRLDNSTINDLYLIMIPGILVGGFICYFWYKQAIRMAWLIFLGFGCFTVSLAMLYFGVAPDGRYQELYIPIFLRGVGMLTLYVAFSIYSIHGLSPKQMLHNAFFIISARSALAPALGTSILMNWLYNIQQKNTMILSENLDMQNPLFVTRFNAAVNTALSQGWSIDDARRIATNSVYNSVQIQAMTVSIKEILGWMLIMGIALMVAILLYFFQFSAVKLKKLDKDVTA